MVSRIGLYEAAQPTPKEMEGMLDSCRWARDMEWDEVYTLATYLSFYRVPEGQNIFEEHDHDRFLAIIIQGKVDILKQDLDDEEQVIATIPKGNIVGEQSLLDQQPRSATARANQATELLVLSGSNYELLRVDEAEVALTIVEKIARTLSIRLRWTSGALMKALAGTSQP